MTDETLTIEVGTPGGMVFAIPAEIEEVLSAAASRRGQLQRACLAALLEHEHDGALPTSNRFIFYELVGRGVVSKEQTGKRRADQDLQDALMHLRVVGLIPWEWIVDETRMLHEWRYAESVASYLNDSVEAARIDCWGGEPAPLLLCESRTFGGVLRRTLAAEYLCPLAATNGQVGGFLRTDIAPLLQDNDRRVLYVGDHDHQGNQIEANTRGVLERETGRGLDWQRLALTDEQVAEQDLPTATKADRRYKPVRYHDAVEVEALGQVEVTTIIRAGLDALLPEPLPEVRSREQAQRELAAEVLSKLNGSA